jgi:hypothetical protein
VLPDVKPDNEDDATAISHHFEAVAVRTAGNLPTSIDVASSNHLMFNIR